jgi:Flp pilus assembly pilin Flp
VETKMTTENQVNEIVEVQNQVADVVQSENEDFAIVKDAEGKFKRKAKFKNYCSIKAETRADKMWLFNLYEGNEENGNGLKEHVGKQIVVNDVITRKYDRINEETGAIEYGVLTYLITKDKIAYVTSSKTVYFSVMRTFEAFGYPGEAGWEPITFKVGKQKGQNGDIIKVTMVG